MAAWWKRRSKANVQCIVYKSRDGEMGGRKMDYQAAFNDLYPGFFDNEGIRGLPEDEYSIEMVLPLDMPLPPAPPCPEGIRFGWYRGDLALLHRAVAQVEEDWVRYFRPETRVLCAFAGEEPVAFCTVGDYGTSQGLRIGGPGCVGTVPEYRKQGVGLRLVWEATRILKERGFSLSWIHYTYLEEWYGKLGYQTVLKWNGKGFLPLS